MVDLKSLQQEIEAARLARREAESAGCDLEYLVGQMRAGRSLQEIETEEDCAD